MNDRAYAAGDAIKAVTLNPEQPDSAAAVEAWRAAFDHMNQHIIGAPTRGERPAAEVSAALQDNSLGALRRRYEPDKWGSIDAARARKAKSTKAKKAARKKGRR